MSLKLVLVCLVCLFSVWLSASITPFTQIGLGHYAGEMASYSSGNYIAIVYNENVSDNPAQISSVVYKYSTDSGAHWYSSVIDATWGGFCRPTLSINGNEILVTYMQGSVRRLAKSTDNGGFWSLTNMGSSFEKSPYIEHIGEQYRAFELDLPYPEDRQREFCSVIDPEEMVCPQFVTDKEVSWNLTPVYFHGGDVIYGAIRSNSSIWIKRTGGGTNNGWPIFYGPVVTSGSILTEEPYSEAMVFRGGLVTNAPTIEMPSIHPDLDDGVVIGPTDYDPLRITYVTVNNRTYQVWLGQLSAPRTETAQVYSNYPIGGTYIGTNTYTVRDTTWSYYGSGTINSDKLRVNGKLWIKGTFGGDQTWICPDTISIVGDILLYGTVPGIAPDLVPNTNTSDFVKLISGKQIFLKYGYTDPQTGTRIHPLCRADSNPIKIYASLYTLNYEEGDPRADGCLSFEYQHPHPSFPTYEYQGSYYNNIDLHRYIYPQTTTNDWPGYVDYPWYNPLWPESTPYLERGTFQIWGSLMQRRRGFVHRSYFDMEYNLGGNWNTALDFCGGPSNYTYSIPDLQASFMPINYPGTTGGGIGYKKDYRGDKRQGINPELFSFGIRLGERNISPGNFNRRYLHQYSKRVREKSFARRGETALYSVNDHLICEISNQFYDLSTQTLDQGNIVSLAVTADDNALVMQIMPFGNQYRLRILEIEPGTGEILYQNTDYVMTRINALAVSPDGTKVISRLVYDNGYQIQIAKLINGTITPVETFPQSWLIPSEETNESRLYIKTLGSNTLNLFISKRQTGGDIYNPHSFVYHARAVVNGLDGEEELIPQPGISSLTAFPNPMQSELKLRISAPGRKKIMIFNLRGQSVRQIEPPKDSPDEVELVWDGLADDGSPCGRGIYLIRLECENGDIHKRMIIKN